MAEPTNDDGQAPPAKRLKTESTPTAIGITEPDVGITQYLSPDIKGFKGILKQRYTDFLVNEIGEDGKVQHLVDLGLPERNRGQEQKKEIADEKPKNETPQPSDEHRQKLVSYLGEEFVDQMTQLFHRGTKLESEVKFEDKEERTKLHQLIREAYNSRLESATNDKNQFVITLATTRSRKNTAYNRGVDSSAVGDKTKPFLQFLIYKENKETMEVAAFMAKLLRVPTKSIAFAGTKDRRGVTVQRASIGKIKVERINGLNRSLRNVKLGSFQYCDQPLQLGDLLGNQFFITIRDVDTVEHLDALMQSLRTNGFINYYGMQRFGTFSISTHVIGKHILNGEYDKVVDLILSPQELVLPESVEARKIWADTRDARAAIEKMPKKCVAEHAILRSLVKDPSVSINAIMQVPRNLRVMYVHAYQSYIWNHAASERIAKYGLKVVPGDLVIDDTKVDNHDVDNDIIEDVKESGFVRARVVTEEDLASKSIFDVVLPTPGFDILYPQNEIETVYKETMAADGIDYKKMTRNIKEFSLPGSYRTVLAKPSELEYWVKKYSLPTDQLVHTDLDMINKGLTEDSRVIGGTDGDKTAVVLKMQLGSSTYATMALREIMKLDTSRRGDGLDVRT